MEYVKANTKVLQEMLSKYDELSSHLDEVISKLNSFKNTATSESSSWKNGEYWKKYYNAPNIDNYKDDKGEVTSAYYSAKSAASNAAIAKVNSLVKSYQSALADLPNLTEARNKIESVSTILKGVSLLIRTFESMATETDYLDLNKVAESLGEGYAVETVTIHVDGEDQQVQVLMYEDEDGNKYTVSELVNAFYTFTGVTANNAVVLASKGLSGEQLESSLSSMVDATALGVDSQLQRGFYSVASQAGIGAMYEDAMGKTYDEAVVKTEYSSILEKNNIDDKEYNDALAGFTNSAALGGMAMAGALFAGLNFRLDIPDEAILEQSGGTPSGGSPSGGTPSGDGSTTFNTEKEEITKTPIDEDDDTTFSIEEEEITFPPIDDEDQMPGDEDLAGGFDRELEVLDPEEPEEPEEIEQLVPEITDEQAQDILTKMQDIDIQEQIEPIPKETITSEEIDNQARDQYYSNQEQVIENRTKSYDNYELMTDEERVSALESFGYDHETAKTLVEDKNKGQTAYLVGVEEKELSRISNDIAQNEGISELDHDTKFDDGHNLEYVDSGDIHLDMAMIDENVQKAREELTVAKNDYDESVSVANEAITKANTARKDYDTLLETIKNENGADPKGWTKEQVSEYNKAVTNYNDALKDAQDKTSLVTGKKELYEKEKVEYQDAYKEYRNEVQTKIEEINRENSQPETSENDESGEPSGGKIEITDDGIKIT